MVNTSNATTQQGHLTGKFSFGIELKQLGSHRNRRVTLQGLTFILGARWQGFASSIIHNLILFIIFY